MSSKFADLKQTLSFRSLRLMEWKDSQGSSMRSFSDSEANNGSSASTKIDATMSKSKSETNLDTLTTASGAEDGQSYEYLKAFSNSDLFVPRSKKADIGTEQNFHINLTLDPALESEAQIHDNISISEKVIHQSNVEPSGASTLAISFEKGMNMPIKESNKTVDTVSNINHNSDTMSLQNSSPYPVLEGEQNLASKSELILGEPRCLALKKNDINPFLTDDPLIFEPDFEDDNRSFNQKTTIFKRAESNLEKFVNDMFVDEDEVSATKKKGLLIDKEEGELTPEAPVKSLDVNKSKEPSSSEKKTTLEFFNKINECLRDLNDKCREFYSSSTPDYSLAHLQRTLGNVDNIKRKLGFLIKSKNNEKEEKDKEKRTAHRSHTNMRLHSERFAKSNSAMGDNKSGQEKQEQYSSLKNDVEELYRQLKENREKRNSEIISRHGHRRERSNRDRPSQADLLNRKKISMLEKLGTKQEIERVQSLFKRQMNLITQHVIQKRETDKKHTTSRREETQRKRRRRYSSQSHDEHDSRKSRDRMSLNDLKTLEDMEKFLDSLKKDKMLCEQYMDDQKSKGMLKFSSKKEKRVVPDAPSDSPAAALVKTSKDSKEAFKQPLVKEAFHAAIPKPNKIREESLTKVETKQNVEVIKMKNPKNTTPISASDALSLHKSSEPLKKADISSSNLVSRSKNELSKIADRIEPEALMNETQKHRSTHRDLDTNPKTTDFSIAEISLKERGEPSHKLHKHQNILEKGKQNDSKRKRQDLSESNFNKLENENEEKSSKKLKPIKYLAARRISEDNQSQTKCNTRNEKTNGGTAESLVNDLLSKKVVILDDNGVAINNEFCIKVINNEVFLKKVSNKRKRRHTRRPLKPRQSKNIKRSKNNQPSKENFKEIESKFDQKTTESKLDQKPTESKLGQKPTETKFDQKSTESKLDQEIIEPEIDPETIDNTLNEMENFLQDLRSKRKNRDDETHHPIENTSQNREMKFLARIQAKRKAKLMACVSGGVYSTEKEAKFLKALEKRDEDVSESSDVETRKQAFLEKSRAEKDAIAEKPKAKQNDDDPLKDVKAFLDMIKEAESGNDENAKQVYVSFSLKRSDVKKLENLTTGKASLLAEESQKFLNNVRSKMKAKKAPGSGLSALMRKPEV